MQTPCQAQKRLILYFHYHPQGQADSACRFAVQAMAGQGVLWFITNGTLQPESKTWATGAAARVIERPNTGYDVGAYRQVLLELGPEGLQPYGEVVLMNYTLAGPVWDLGPMFAAMAARPELDFWGLTKHYPMQSRRFGGAVPEHLQSHFLAVRRSLFEKPEFWRYWREMPLPESYEDSVKLHETRFTPHFAALGCRWDAYVPTDDLKPLFVHPLMACPRELIRRRGCPFFKRRSFFTPYADELRRTDGLAGRELYDYLKTQTNYPVDALVKDLLREKPLAGLAQNLHWHFVLPAGTEKTELPPDLQLVHLPLPTAADEITQYYLKQTAQQAEEQLPVVAALFRQNPLLGVASPALPLWPGALAAQQAQWQQDCPALQKLGLTVPFAADTMPPVPNAGWAVVRKAAFPGGLPALQTAADGWLLPLLAQQNGYACVTFESAAQAAGRADILAQYQTDAAQPATVARQLARLAKRGLNRK